MTSSQKSPSYSLPFANLNTPLPCFFPPDQWPVYFSRFAQVNVPCVTRLYLPFDLAQVPVALVLVPVGPDFLAFPVLQTVFEVAREDALVFQDFCAFPVGPVVRPVAFISAPVGALELAVAAGQVVEDCPRVLPNVRYGVAGGPFFDLRPDKRERLGGPHADLLVLRIEGPFGFRAPPHSELENLFCGLA